MEEQYRKDRIAEIEEEAKNLESSLDSKIKAADQRLFGVQRRYETEPYELNEMISVLDQVGQHSMVEECRPIEGKGLKKFLKRVFRKCVRFYIRPIVEEQNNLNAVIEKGLDQVYQFEQSMLQVMAENDRLVREVQWMKRQIPAVEKKKIRKDQMRVVQMLPSLAFGDGIGNDTLALKKTLEENGYETEIYVEWVDERLPQGTARSWEEYEERPDDILLYHLSTGSEMNYRLADYRCRKVVIYHNVTPPHFFAEYHPEAWQGCKKGLEAVRFLADKVDYCFADSAFNKGDLRKMGYQGPIEVLPILIAFEDFEKQPNQAVLERYQGDGYTNIVYTGRVVPHKRQEDLITAFYYYKKNYNPKSRLILVGAYGEQDRFYQNLREYERELGVEDVIFTGHTKFDEILAYYQLADVYLSMSEHEGFCIPLVEAMYFEIPIIAYDSCAVGETLGGSGLLLSDKNPQPAAAAIHRVVTDSELRQAILAGEKERLSDFSHEKIQRQFLQRLEALIEEEVS
ncbi:glycosyltransferase family 4 protein [Hominifimenecus sp. rT4P-3]|uniref:glycosyltransferase family 4 protein n=1 Tax=Hominifimenecus sp. rT4P-3 TaxID=3242979 RepID=UPI003DA44C94